MEWKAATPWETWVEGPSTQISRRTTQLWNDICYITCIGIQTQPKVHQKSSKSQTTKLVNVHMLFVTGHEKILN